MKILCFVRHETFKFNPATQPDLYWWDWIDFYTCDGLDWITLGLDPCTPLIRIET